MKKISIILCFLAISVPKIMGQGKNFIDQPYIEVTATADTFLVPDEIYVKIVLSEKETRDRISVEEQEAKMITALKALNINTEENLKLGGLSSSMSFVFLISKNILKNKEYVLKLDSAAILSEVFVSLEKIDISNVGIEKVSHSNIAQVKDRCLVKAVENAKTKAVLMTKPLNETIDKALYISDSNVAVYESVGKITGVRIRGISTINNKAEYSAPKIEFEKIRVSSSVSIKFALK